MRQDLHCPCSHLIPAPHIYCIYYDTFDRRWATGDVADYGEVCRYPADDEAELGLSSEEAEVVAV